MPPGRHRHSPPLHKLLPPSTIAGVSAMCAAGAWFSLEPMVLRGLAAGAAVAAVVGAVAMRSWDRAAGRRVAALERTRQSDRWAHEERAAELEGDLEESREIRAALERRLRTKRSDLAALRNEHAALLRRYATAETERASALEGRRLLAIEAAPARPSLASDGAASGPSAAAPQTTPPGARPGTAPDPAVAVPASPVPTPSLYLRANAALDRLIRNTGGPVDRGTAPGGPREESSPADDPGADGPRAADGPGGSRSEDHRRAGRRVLPAAGPRPVPHAAAVVAPAAPVRHAPAGGFDFFGTKAAEDGSAGSPSAPLTPAPSGPTASRTGSFQPSPAASTDLEAVQNEDLADVVGEEALADHKAAAEAEFKPATGAQREVGQVIDLTAHDETEPIDVSGLRNAVS